VTAPPILWTKNGLAVERSAIPSLGVEVFREACVEAVTAGGRLSAISVLPAGPGAPGGESMLAVISDDAESRVGFLQGTVPDDRRYPALSIDLPQAQAFEREILEDYGIVPEGHPWPKPLRRLVDLESGKKAAVGAANAHSFFRVEGSGVHEVAVGPVHAGIIEPGHFRFQCQGEKVLHLETRLGYQHRGAEGLFLKAAHARRLVVAESVAGDTAVGHALAYCAAMEGLCRTEAPLSAQAIRGIALELERIANHIGDLGALCGDVGYLTGASWLGRLRGEFLNMLLEIAGHRFGRGLVIPGGVRFDIDPTRQATLIAAIDRLEGEFDEISEGVFEAPSVVSRFEQTGILTRSAAEELGCVGPVARASGSDRDVRRDHPSGIYRYAHIPVALQESGDVMARAILRRTEVKRSIQFAREQLEELKEGVLVTPPGPSRPDACVATLVEGWRGEIAHLAVTDSDGCPCGYKFVDPSFHNWFALGLVMRDRQISDFPLCNKSFNLSYAGHDL